MSEPKTKPADPGDGPGVAREPDQSDQQAAVGGPLSWWAELRKRKVIRVAAVYAAVGWGIIVGSADLTQILVLPDWLPQATLAIVVLGFPVALVLAWAYDVTARGVRRTAPMQPSRGRPSRRPFVAGLVIGTASMALVGFLLVQWAGSAGGGQGDVLDGDRIAIMPFGYTGPDDANYLGEGVSELLAARFTGEVGPQAEDATATAVLWNQADPANPNRALDVARQLGTRLVVRGAVVVGPGGATLAATLTDVEAETDLATATAEGSVDSLPAVIERLAGALLGLSVGTYGEDLRQLMSADFDALKDYFQGQFAFRRGRLLESYGHFARALEKDSSFALAAIWVADAGNNVIQAIETSSSEDALEQAWRHWDRLGDRDLAYLQARLGPEYPAPATREERLRAYAEALRLNPNRANIWYFLGENILHRPAGPEAYELAGRYFQRAVELDPYNANALLHALISAFLRGDIPGSVEAADRLAALDTTNALQRLPRWIRAVDAHDSVMATALYDSVDALASAEALELHFMDMPALLVGEWQADALVRAFDRLASDLIPGTASAPEYLHPYYALQDLGRPRRALEILEVHERAAGTPHNRERLLCALYGALPEEAGVAAAAALKAGLEGFDDRTFSRPLSREDLLALADRTAVDLWRASRGELVDVDEVARTYRDLIPERTGANRLSLEARALLLESMLQVRRGDPAARESLAAADTLILEGLPGLPIELYDALIMATADTYERLGDPEQALEVLGRESNFDALGLPFGARYARERGRLAALTGDTGRAIREYEVYTIMRARPEPELEPEAREARKALAALRTGRQ